MNKTLIDYLSRRRTVPSLQLDEPGPLADQLSEILTIAARVPDHGKLVPWRFILFAKDQRLRAEGWLRSRAAALSEFGEKGPEVEKAVRFVRAPVVVGVVSSPTDHPKIPVWEQQLSAAAVCLNLIHAAHAHGFSAQWLTDWLTYDRVNLSASASMEVAQDELQATLYALNEGENAGETADAVSHDIQQALQIIFSQKAIIAQTGSFNLTPIFSP